MMKKKQLNLSPLLGIIIVFLTACGAASSEKVNNNQPVIPNTEIVSSISSQETSYEYEQSISEFITLFSSDRDLKRFVDTLQDLDLSDDEKQQTAQRYYHLMMKALYKNQMIYPDIQEVSTVPTPDIIVEDEIIEKTAETALYVQNTDGNTYLLYLQSPISGLCWNIVLYNNEVIYSVFVTR